MNIIHLYTRFRVYFPLPSSFTLKLHRFFRRGVIVLFFGKAFPEFHLGKGGKALFELLPEVSEAASDLYSKITYYLEDDNEASLPISLLFSLKMGRSQEIEELEQIGLLRLLPPQQAKKRPLRSGRGNLFVKLIKFK